MPFDPQRLARVRVHLLSAAALVTAGCGAAPGTDHPGDPVHVNQPADSPPSPSAGPTASPTLDHKYNEPAQVNPPPPGTATVSPPPTTPKPQ